MAVTVTYAQDFLRYLQTESAEHLQHVQLKVYKGELTDEEHADGMATYFYDLPTTAKRRNAYVHPSSAKAGDLRIFALPDLVEANGLGSSPGAFVYPGECARFDLRTPGRSLTILILLRQRTPSKFHSRRTLSLTWIARRARSSSRRRWRPW